LETDRKTAIHRWCIVIVGIAALFAGSLVYFTDRPPGQTYFIIKIFPKLNLQENLLPVFGKTADFFPDFVHPFGFSLITAGFFAKTKAGVFIICLFWFCVNAAFELGQHYKSFAASLVPQWFEGLLFLENCKDFFRYGSFDPFDLMAMLIGSLTAFFIASRILK